MHFTAQGNLLSDLGDPNGKETQERRMCAYIRLTYFAVQQELTLHCDTTIFQF